LLAAVLAEIYTDIKNSTNTADCVRAILALYLLVPAGFKATRLLMPCLNLSHAQLHDNAHQKTIIKTP